MDNNVRSQACKNSLLNCISIKQSSFKFFLQRTLLGVSGLKKPSPVACGQSRLSYICLSSERLPPLALVLFRELTPGCCRQGGVFIASHRKQHRANEFPGCRVVLAVRIQWTIVLPCQEPWALVFLKPSYHKLLEQEKAFLSQVWAGPVGLQLTLL